LEPFPHIIQRFGWFVFPFGDSSLVGKVFQKLSIFADRQKHRLLSSFFVY